MFLLDCRSSRSSRTAKSKACENTVCSSSSGGSSRTAKSRALVVVVVVVVVVVGLQSPWFFGHLLCFLSCLAIGLKSLGLECKTH
jgi:hypothetical protein